MLRPTNIRKIRVHNFNCSMLPITDLLRNFSLPAVVRSILVQDMIQMFMHYAVKLLNFVILLVQSRMRPICGEASEELLYFVELLRIQHRSVIWRPCTPVKHNTRPACAPRFIAFVRNLEFFFGAGGRAKFKPQYANKNIPAIRLQLLMNNTLRRSHTRSCVGIPAHQLNHQVKLLHSRAAI